MQVKNLSAMLQLRMFLICIIIGMIVCFGVVDLQLQELYIRFDEENIELLQYISCLTPTSSFVLEVALCYHL